MRFRHYMFIVLLLCTNSAYGAEFLISYFCPPPQLTLERIQEVKDANFNVAMLNGDTASANKNALNFCQQVGIKGLVMDSRLYNLKYHPGDSRFSVYMNSIINDYSSHPAFWGYYINDEPTASTFDIYGGVTDYLTAHDPNHIPYMNLLPTYATPEQLGAATYEDYVDLYLSKVHPKILSYDNYPLINNGTERADYYQNLEIIRSRGLSANIPFAAVILSTPHLNYRDPNEDEINWQINSSLAYGAKGVFYYTYGTYDAGYYNSIKIGRASCRERVLAGV